MSAATRTMLARLKALGYTVARKDGQWHASGNGRTLFAPTLAGLLRGAEHG